MPIRITISPSRLDARAAIDAAQVRHEDPAAPSRILLVNGSARTGHTCPGEMSKSWRMVELARAASLRRGLSDWAGDMHLVTAGANAELDGYIGYYEPYATSHEALDKDTAFHVHDDGVRAGQV